MKYLIYNKKEDTQVITEKYPRANISEPLEGSNDIQIYVIVDVRPNYNLDKSYLRIGEVELTTEIFEKHNHLFIANQLYDIINYPEDIIIANLNESLGIYLDKKYPLWERTKHAGEGSYILLDMINNKTTQEQLDRKSYIDSIYAWITGCRIEAKNRINKYLTNNIFPDFGNYPERPI